MTSESSGIVCARLTMLDAMRSRHFATDCVLRRAARDVEAAIRLLRWRRRALERVLATTPPLLVVRTRQQPPLRASVREVVALRAEE